MPAYVENSAVTTGLEKVSFPSNPKEKEMQESEVVCEEPLQIAEKRREAKGKGEK